MDCSVLRAVVSRLGDRFIAAWDRVTAALYGVVMKLFQSSCASCGAPANGICGACVAALEPAVVPSLLAVHSATVLCSYSGVGAKVVQALKFRNNRQVLSPLVDALAKSLTGDFDAIVAVPSNPIRLRERGFDIPALMAKRLSKKLDVPIATPLTRVDSGSQTGRPRAERHGVEFRSADRVPERILLVDDVVTTGATAVSCALTLGLAGARSLSFVALAATPAPATSEQVPVEVLLAGK